MELLKVTIWLKHPVQTKRGAASKLGTDTLIVTDHSLLKATECQHELGTLFLKCVETGKIYSVPEHQIGFVEAVPIEEKVKGHD